MIEAIRPGGGGMSVNIKKMLVESVAELAIREISSDPKRAIRSLLDLGQQNTQGGFRCQFLKFCQKTLEDESSPYYEMVYNAIRQIDRETVKTLCVNLGYHSWSRGARQLRSFRDRTGVCLPWNVTFHLDRTTDEEALRQYGKLMERGQSSGVYCYSFMLSDGFACAEWLFGLMLANKECVFFLFLPSGADAWEPERLRLLHNAVMLVNTGGPDWERALARLNGAGCVAGIYRSYATDEDAAEIESGRWLEQTAGQPCLCALALADPSAADGPCRRVRSYVEHSRSDPEAPTFVVDYYRDFSSVSEIIVGRPLFSGVAADGCHTACDGYREVPAEEPLPDCLILDPA